MERVEPPIDLVEESFVSLGTIHLSASTAGPSATVRRLGARGSGPVGHSLERCGTIASRSDSDA